MNSVDRWNRQQKRFLFRRYGVVGGLTADMEHRRRAITEAIVNEPLKNS